MRWPWSKPVPEEAVQDSPDNYPKMENGSLWLWCPNDGPVESNLIRSSGGNSQISFRGEGSSTYCPTCKTTLLIAPGDYVG